MTPAASQLLAETAGAFPPGPFIVALSGGPDSAVLAWLSTQLARPEPPRAVFIDHGWHHSDLMQRAATRIAAQLGMALECIRVAPSTTESEARVLRLQALEAAAGGRRIVTGHHGDDLAETVLRNVARGAGAAGLAGIPEARGVYVRPLLGVTRARLRSVARALELPFADDPANADHAHQRNLIRAEVLPRLAQAVPGAEEGLRRSAELAAADERLLERRVDTIPIRHRAGEVSVPAAALAALPPPVASRLVRRALRLLRPPYAGDRRVVAAVLATAYGPAVDIGDGLRAAREGALVTVYDASLPLSMPDPVALPVPGEVEFGSHVLGARVCDAAPLAVRGRHHARIDAGLAADLVIRAPASGERVDIGNGHKLVSDAFNEAAIPPRLRFTWPLVTAHGKIAWIAGVRLAAWARPQRDAGAVLELTTERR